MGWQIITALSAFLFTGRAALFLIGVILGGMMTVASPKILGVMQTLVEWWQFLISALFG